MSIAVDEFHSSPQLPSIFYRRPEMIRFKTILNFVIVFSVLFGLIFVIGCGSSAEKQAMSDFLKLYSDTVDKYSAADVSKKAEMKEELNSFKSKWSNMKMEMDGELTPQALNELDKEYNKIRQNMPHWLVYHKFQEFNVA
jgi:hypothetical protein